LVSFDDEIVDIQTFGASNLEPLNAFSCYTECYPIKIEHFKEPTFMKFGIIFVVFATLLSGCVTRPSIDYTKVDQACGLQCAMNDQACASRFAGFPLILEANCNPAVEACVKACPQISASTTNTVSDSVKNSSGKPSVTERLNELESLRKNGMISDSEYSAKKQEILKAL
jgi:hypothetical protein